MIDLGCLNSATKYPSIPTYHTLGERGILTEERIVFPPDVMLTEQVDGTNGRIIRMPDGDWFIGSREELFTARGDRVHNTGLGIVDALRPLAERLKGEPTDKVMVFFLEVYGAGVGQSAKQYSGQGNVGYRLFDLAYVPTKVLDWPRDKIAYWREDGGQVWSTEFVLERAAEVDGIELTPRLGLVPATALPTSVEDTAAWLEEILPRTHVALDAGAGKRAEGIVLRGMDRTVIAKARFQDYARTLAARQPQQGKPKLSITRSA